MTPVLNWVYFNDKHKSWRTGGNKNKQSTSWSLHLRNNLCDLGVVPRFCQPLRDCRRQKGSLKTTHLPTYGARGWRMFFRTDSMLVCLLALISDVKLDPAFQIAQLVIWKNSWKTFLSHTTGTQHVNRFLPPWTSPISTFLFFLSNSKLLSSILNFSPLFKSRKYHNTYQVTPFLFYFYFFSVLIFVFLKYS